VRRRGAPALLLLAGVLVTGCSEEGEDYCGALADEQKTLDDLADRAAAGGEDLLTPTVEAFTRLRSAAPDELQDEWETVVNAYQALVDAVESAGIDPADYTPGDPPAGLSAADEDRLASVADKLASFRVSEAAAGIEQHADEVCNVDFSG
jgi:hypothetical protein